MPHIRRYLPPLLLLLPLIFICGKLLLTPVTGILVGYDVFDGVSLGPNPKTKENTSRVRAKIAKPTKLIR